MRSVTLLYLQLRGCVPNTFKKSFNQWLFALWISNDDRACRRNRAKHPRIEFKACSGQFYLFLGYFCVCLFLSFKLDAMFELAIFLNTLRYHSRSVATKGEALPESMCILVRKIFDAPEWSTATMKVRKNSKHRQSLSVHRTSTCARIRHRSSIKNMQVIAW